MIEVRPFSSLGRFDNDWLAARYHFSFSNYFDPKRTQWGALRVWNDDMIQPQTGFPPHSHANMEIITYVREGAITHEDGLGNRGRTEAGDVQVMSAGSGVSHAEFNLEDEPTRLFQIWILPKQAGGGAYWKTAKFPKDDRAGAFVALASGFTADQEAGALPIRQDARVLGATLKAGGAARYALEPGRSGYVVVAKGAATLNGQRLGERDGAAFRDEAALELKAETDSELVLVDAP